MKLKLIDKVQEARGTKSFFWEPEAEVTFLPGQYLYYTLPKLNYSDSRGATRQFTISSSSTEQNLRLTTRIRQESGFKKTLDELPIGSVVDVQGPNGSFLFDENVTGPKIFLAGGIGITPFRSIIKYVIDKKLSIPLHLIYSNSDSEFVFKKDLEQWSSGPLKVVFVDSAVTGHLNETKIKEMVTDWNLGITETTFWTVGPPAFVTAIEDILEKMHVPSDHNRTEKFIGY